MKKKAILMWILFVVCIVGTVALRYLSDRQDVQYEEVSATVISAQEKVMTNRKTHSTYTSYEITVKYDGKEYDLKNAHGIYGFNSGAEVTAYLSNGKLYANIEGVESSTPLFYAYFAFLIASPVMLGVAINESVKA
ncbi:MAG: penicillin-binding protein, partial [Lachnospiraceae bacterium]|nr:penicillin-binding protein [Lachnospiraceae bacterium]